MRPDLTELSIYRACTSYKNVHATLPSRDSGDASPYFGRPETWRGIHNALVYGYRGLPKGSSLAEFKVRNGLQPARVKRPQLTLQKIRAAMRAFYKVHGVHPHQRSGDASAYFGHPETWGAVDSALRKGYCGLKGGTSLRNLNKRA